MAEVYEYDGCKAIVDCENMTVTIQDGNGRSLRVFSGFRYSDDIDSFLHFGDFGPLVCNEFMTVTRPTFKLECEEEDEGDEDNFSGPRFGGAEAMG